MIVANPFAKARPGNCQNSPNCYCFKARLCQNCQSCHQKVNIGDCITHNTCGWTHVECPGSSEGERGLPAIMAGLNQNVDYGNSYLAKMEMGEGQTLSLPSPLQPNFIDYDEEDQYDEYEEDDQYDEDEEDSDGDVSFIQPHKLDFDLEADEESDPLEDMASSKKRAKYEEQSRSGVVDEPDQYASKRSGDFSNEQVEILQYDPDLGEVVAVNALAGCGKTTTIALLCHKVRKDYAHCKILYLVYNSAIQEEAMQSKKFPKENMEIRTTHAYVQRHYFGPSNMQNVKPTGDYTVTSITEEIGLLRDCAGIFTSVLQLEGRRGNKILKKRVNTIANFIIKTLNNYQNSDSLDVRGSHVPRRAKTNTTRTLWYEQIGVNRYVHWATQVFEAVKQKCRAVKDGRDHSSKIEITYDGYMKVAQLEQLHIDHDYILVDEAQDMSACQADLFWGLHQRRDKKIYLFGDKNQQIYRFRGACHSFQDMVNNSAHRLSLTGSFRFGVNIAVCATCVLKALGGEVLHGRSENDGVVEEFVEDAKQPTMKRGLVLCRSQNGILQYLYSNKPKRWCTLHGKFKIPESPKSWQLKLELFVRYQLKKQEEGDESENDDEASVSIDYGLGSNVQYEERFRYKGEKFEDLNDLYDYCQEEEDVELGKAIHLLKFLVSKRKPLSDFYADLRKSFYPMSNTESPEQYDGLVLSTIHNAKGLEWESPILIYGDFRFKAILSAVLNERAHSDEANLLYVAITRAKRHLYLSSPVKSCLDELSKLNHVKLKLPAMMSLDWCRAKFETWSNLWASFNSASDAIKSNNDVPFPPDWNDDMHPLALHPRMSMWEQRHILLRYLRVYHPDKFLPTLGKRVILIQVYDDLKDTIEQIAMKCTDLLRCLQEEGDAGCGE